MRIKVTDLHPKIEWIYTNRSTKVSCRGIVHLQKGTVIVDKISDRGFKMCLGINYNGKYHEKFYDKWYSRRFCTTLAKRFMKEVVELTNRNEQIMDGIKKKKIHSTKDLVVRVTVSETDSAKVEVGQVHFGRCYVDICIFTDKVDKSKSTLTLFGTYEYFFHKQLIGTYTDEELIALAKEFQEKASS